MNIPLNNIIKPFYKSSDWFCINYKGYSIRIFKEDEKTKEIDIYSNYECSNEYKNIKLEDLINILNDVIKNNNTRNKKEISILDRLIQSYNIIKSREGSYILKNNKYWKINDNYKQADVFGLFAYLLLSLNSMISYMIDKNPEILLYGFPISIISGYSIYKILLNKGIEKEDTFIKYIMNNYFKKLPKQIEIYDYTIEYSF